MVGVPGRSKACSTCRCRKKGCDYARPACTQCLSAGLECGGYQRERVFVHADQQSWVSGGKGEYKIQRTHQHGISQNEPQSVVLPKALQRTAFEDRFIGIWWQLFLPGGRAISPAMLRFTFGSWTGIIQKSHPRVSALRLSLLANCLCSVGRRDAQPWLVQEGMALYGQALRATVAALARPSTSAGRGTALVLTSKLLTMFELFHGADGADRLAQSRSFTRHNLGELALYLVQGPEAFVRGDAHQLFVDARINLAILDTKERRASPLNEMVWKTVPWREVPKTPKDELVDIYMEIPGLLERVDMLRSGQGGSGHVDLRLDILEQCWVLDGLLTAWHEKHAPYLPPGEELCHQAQEELHGVHQDGMRYSESDFAACHILTLYWTTCAMTYSTLLSMMPPPDPTIPSDPSLLPDRINPHAYIRNIALAAPLLVDPVCGWFGKSIAAFPIGMALQFLLATDTPGQMSEERRLLNNLLSSPRGRDVKEFLVSLQRDNARAGKSMMMQDGEEASVGRARIWLRGNGQG